MQFLLSVLVLTSSTFCYDNTQWPEDNTTPFPYPTRGPINIITSQARRISTTTPLEFNIDPIQQATITNTGKTLLVTSNQPGLGTATGGVVHSDIYYFINCEFYWNHSLNGNSAHQINGKGSPLQAVANFYNTRYGNLETAKRKPNGILQIIVLIALGILPNMLFGPFEMALQKVLKAGSSTQFPELLAYNWYLLPSKTDDYYAYPGMYQDPETEEIFYSATVVVLERNPQPNISYDQFSHTYGSLRNQEGDKYSHTANIVSRGPRPVVKTSGVTFGYK